MANANVSRRRSIYCKKATKLKDMTKRTYKYLNKKETTLMVEKLTSVEFRKSRGREMEWL